MSVRQISKRFLALPSLAAALALLVSKLIHREYAYAVSLAQSCVTDSHLTGEEQQLWDLLQYVATDNHPDAIGCRLQISLKTEASGLQLPWSIGTELQHYCRLVHKISTACRLQVDEEVHLLKEFGMATRQLRNRKAMLEVISFADAGQELQLKIEQPPEARQGTTCFDGVQDNTCIVEAGDPLRTLAGGLALAAYKPPESGYGSKAVQVLHGLVDSLCLSGNNADKAKAAIGIAARPLPGFVLCLELLSQKLDLKVLQDDNPA